MLVENLAKSSAEPPWTLIGILQAAPPSKQGVRSADRYRTGCADVTLLQGRDRSQPSLEPMEINRHLGPHDLARCSVLSWRRPILGERSSEPNHPWRNISKSERSENVELIVLAIDESDGMSRPTDDQ